MAILQAPDTHSAGEDQRRIAREIHDDFGQRAAALAIFLASLSQKLPKADPLAAELGNLSRNAGELGEDLRRFSHELHPSRLERRGLTESLREHATATASRHGIELDLRLAEDLDSLPFEVSLALFRVVQEGLANILAHAGAKKVQLELRRTPGIRLMLQDDGRGFDLAAARRGSGLGLTGIAERAALFGGTCRIETAPGAGCRLTFEIPPPESPGLWGRLRRLARRHRGEVIAVLLTMLALAGGIFATQREAEHARDATLRADATIRFLEKIFEGANPRRNPEGVPDAVSLLRRSSDTLAKDRTLKPLQRAKLLDSLGGIETELGLYDEARAHLEEALRLRDEEPNEHPLERANTLARLGMLARLSGQGDSVAFYEQAVTLREQYPDEARDELILALNHLGTTLAMGGRLEEGETYLLRSVAEAENTWPADDPRLAKALHNLAGIAYGRKDFAAQERYLLRALAIREKSLAPNDPDRLESQESLALLRLAQGRSDEAARLLEELLDRAGKTFGEEHPNFARILYNLALSRLEQGRPAEARVLLERAWSIVAAKLAPNHWLVEKIRLKLQQLEKRASP